MMGAQYQQVPPHMEHRAKRAKHQQQAPVAQQM